MRTNRYRNDHPNAGTNGVAGEHRVEPNVPYTRPVYATPTEQDIYESQSQRMAEKEA